MTLRLRTVKRRCRGGQTHLPKFIPRFRRTLQLPRVDRNCSVKPSRGVMLNALMSRRAMRSSWQNKKAVKLGNAMNERWAGSFKVESMTAKGVSRLVDRLNVRHLKPYVRGTDTPKDVGIASDVQELSVLCDISMEAVGAECRYFFIYTSPHVLSCQVQCRVLNVFYVPFLLKGADVDHTHSKTADTGEGTTLYRQQTYLYIHRCTVGKISI